jgi:hypothetical protein
VYDYLPDKLLGEISGTEVFAAAFVFDKWIGNADSRQTIFFRPKAAEPMHCWLIDHGYAFNGPYWELLDNTVHGLYFRPLVYSQWRGLADLEPWLSQIGELPAAVIDRALRRLPGSWFEGDQDEFERLLGRLYARRRRLEDLIRDSVAGRPALFPRWAG